MLPLLGLFHFVQVMIKEFPVMGSIPECLIFDVPRYVLFTQSGQLYSHESEIWRPNPLNHPFR